MPKLFWRIFLTLWLCIVGFAVLIAALEDSVSRKQGAGDVEKLLQQRLPVLVKNLQQSLENEGPRVARFELQQVVVPIRNLISISNENHRELLGRQQLLRQHHRLMTAKGDSRIKGQKIKVTDADGMVWTIRVFPAPTAKLLLSSGRRGILARLFLTTLLSAIVSWILARSLARPLVQLRQTSFALAVGRLDSRVEGKILDRGDELGDLARSFNRMAAEIETQDTSRQRLLRDVAHELRSPLARMQVALELARSLNGVDAPVEQPELDIISREISRLEKLIAEVLGLLRNSGSVDALEVENFSLTDLLNSIVKAVNFEAKARAQGKIHFVAEINPELMLSPELIYRAVENLLRNASRYTDPERGVDLSLEMAATGKECKLTIRDYGPGVSAEFLPQLFEPFSRDSAARERSTGDGGWGLGTAIAATAIQRHGGSIKAENALGGGLQITILLPLSDT